jgi:PAS domain-containing protein
MPSATQSVIANNNNNYSNVSAISSVSGCGETPSVGSPVASGVTKSLKTRQSPAPLTSQTKEPRKMGTTSMMNHGTSHQTIAPMPGSNMDSDSESVSTPYSSSDKKQQKRAANRKSAQLSRKRKKQFFEELKEENDELRRKEQILRSIPDLIVVFDSSGKLGFVSQSVSRFLNIPAEDLEGGSFWDRMCEDSVRLLKAAFMDSLAARRHDSDSAPLGSGVWELRLVDKDSKYVVVTLNGVVHFTGDAPECVCCIRPRDQKAIQELPKERKLKTPKPHSRLVSSSDGSRTSEDSGGQNPRIRVNPNQSVISNDISAEENSAGDDSSPQDHSSSPLKKMRRSTHDDIRLSHGGESGCEVSESSGSDDGIASS